MIFDELDIKILKEFYFMEGRITTWKIMQNLFPEETHLPTKHKKNKIIKHRIHKMDGDLFEITKGDDNRYRYILNNDNIKFCKHKFPNGIKDCVMIFSEESWMIFQI